MHVLPCELAQITHAERLREAADAAATSRLQALWRLEAGARRLERRARRLERCAQRLEARAQQVGLHVNGISRRAQHVGLRADGVSLTSRP